MAPEKSDSPDDIDVWVHGQVIRPYVPIELDSEQLDVTTLIRIYGRHHGWGLQFGALKGCAERWFQLPFPAVRGPKHSLRLCELALLFRSEGGCGLSQIDFYDGPNKQDFNLRLEEPLCGRHNMSASGANRWVPRRGDEMLRVSYALNVSLRATFAGEAGWIEFCAAHARFTRAKE